MSERKTAPCIDCAKLVSKWLGASHRYPAGVKTASGYRCQSCFAAKVRGEKAAPGDVA
jgi:hypothetical protein